LYEEKGYALCRTPCSPSDVDVDDVADRAQSNDQHASESDDLRLGPLDPGALLGRANEAQSPPGHEAQNEDQDDTADPEDPRDQLKESVHCSLLLLLGFLVQRADLGALRHVDARVLGNLAVALPGVVELVGILLEIVATHEAESQNHEDQNGDELVHGF